MAAFDWLEKAKGVSSVALTVRAQMLPVNNNGTLLYPLFFKRRDVDSMDLNEILELDDRPTASRREWDAPEKRLPLELPETKEISMVPLGADDLIGERELDKIDAGADGNEEVIRNVIGAKIPARGERLAKACFNQLEVDCFEVAATGKLTQHDPQSKRTYVVDYQIGDDRIQVAGTPWSQINAYVEFIAWLKDAKQAVGDLEGVMATSDVIEDILADAPVSTATGLRLTGADLMQRIKDDAMLPRFAWFEHNGTVDETIGGGVKKRRRLVFPERHLLAVPLGGQLGVAAHAPVRRARQLSRLLPEAKIDIRGVTIFHFGENDDKALKIVSQLNAFPVTNDGKIFSINIGAKS